MKNIGYDPLFCTYTDFFHKWPVFTVVLIIGMGIPDIFHDTDFRISNFRKMKCKYLLESMNGGK